MGWDLFYQLVEQSRAIRILNHLSSTLLNFTQLIIQLLSFFPGGRTFESRTTVSRFS